VRLERLDIATVVRAFRIYIDLAYGPDAGPPSLPDLSLPPDAGVQDVLSVFQRETLKEAAGRESVRYSYRLGNRNYPFMKLILQEHLVAGEFLFAVDTHDEMDIRPDFPDYQDWLAVRRFNRHLKLEIERQFARQGLATAASLRQIVATRERADLPPSARILVVDDEADLAETIENLLRCKGYAVLRADDGPSALGLAEESLPDLILLDYELPEMDGLEVMAVLRARAKTRHIPVLLATAGHISIDDIQKADGFLAKPFPEELLYEMVQRLLAMRRA